MDRRPGMCSCCDAPRGVSRAPRRLPDGTTQHLIISHVADGRLIALFQIAHPGRAYPFPALFLWFKSPRDPACPAQLTVLMIQAPPTHHTNPTPPVKQGYWVTEQWLFSCFAHGA